MTDNQDSEDRSQPTRRFDGPSNGFSETNQIGFGALAVGIQMLDAAISALDSEDDQQLRLAEQTLEEWLRQRGGRGGTE